MTKAAFAVYPLHRRLASARTEGGEPAPIHWFRRMVSPPASSSHPGFPWPARGMALALLGFAFVGCASGPEFPEVSEFGAAPETTPASAPEPVSSPEPAPAHTEPTRAEGATAAIRGMLPPFLGGTSSGSEAKPVPEEPGGYSIVGVFYATNRERTGSLEPKRFYNETRGDLEYGRAYVTIPQSHQHGLLETRRFYELLTDEDPDDHITVAQLRPYGSEDIFLEGLRRGFRGKDPREVLLVVHGFNSSFEMSVRRTAQIACDTDFAGTPLVFSWASRGKRNLVPSTADAAEIESAQPHLTDLRHPRTFARMPSRRSSFPALSPSPAGSASTTTGATSRSPGPECCVSVNGSAPVSFPFPPWTTSTSPASASIFSAMPITPVRFPSSGTSASS